MSEQAGPRRASRGQTLALFALMLPFVLMGLLAVGVDGANLFMGYRDAQSAADLAALAGARLLPENPSVADQAAARAMALTIAANNGFSSGVTVTTPYVDAAGTHASQIAVAITNNVRLFIGPALIPPINTLPVSVRAVAESEWSASGGTLPAVFAGCSSTNGGTSCPDPAKALEWSGSDGTVLGGIVSNCSLLVPGSNNDFLGGTEYGTSTGCLYQNNGGGNVYTPAAAPAPRQDWPVTFVYSDFLPCTYTVSGKLEVKFYYQNSTTKTLRPGVYCATGSGAEIVVDEFAVNGDVTLVSQDKITIAGSNFNLRAYHPSKVVLWAGGTSSPTITIGGSNGTFTGIIYARTGQIEISGSSNTTVDGGSILGDRVKIGGQGVTVDSAGLNALGPPTLLRLRLLE